MRIISETDIIRSAFWYTTLRTSPNARKFPPSRRAGKSNTDHVKNQYLYLIVLLNFWLLYVFNVCWHRIALFFMCVYNFQQKHEANKSHCGKEFQWKERTVPFCFTDLRHRGHLNWFVGSAFVHHAHPIRVCKLCESYARQRQQRVVLLFLCALLAAEWLFFVKHTSVPRAI